MPLVHAFVLSLCSFQGSAHGPVHPGRLLVKLREGSSAAEALRFHEASGAKVLRDLPQIRWQVLEVPQEMLAEIRESYSRHPLFERADLDRSRPLAYTPNDPYWPYMWHMTNIKADQAWDTDKGGSSVQVAIMDTGLEVTHPDLVANVWTNAGEIAGNGLDDDVNGYVDDVNGYDFAYLDSNPDDVYGHGTACAGLVAAVQDNSIGVTGVAPLCQLVGVKASIDSGYFYDSANVPALIYCADMGFEVISMSFFSDFVTPAERDAIDYCWKNGVVPVAAAGNATSVLPYYPGAYENVISVAAIDGSNLRTWFTNFGSWVDAAAPGLSLSTTTIYGGYTTGFAGTSGACPHVSGLAALLFSAVPGSTPFKVRRSLEDTAIPVVDAAVGEYTNYGRIDCKAAIDRLKGSTSGPKPGRFLFASPIAGLVDVDVGTRGRRGQPPILIYGVGLEKQNDVRILRNGFSQPLLSQTRNWVKVDPAPHSRKARLLSSTALFEIEVNQQIVGSFTWEQGDGLWYAPSDVGATYDGTVVGGFDEIYRQDGSVLAATRRSDGLIHLQLAVRKILWSNVRRMDIEFVRSYENSIGATEYVDFYDWDSYSYPYGSFINVSTRAITSDASETVAVSLTDNPGKFIDDEGTMYIQITTAWPPSDARLLADSFRIRVE